MDDLVDRINASADLLCRGKRHEAADRHIEAMRIAERIAGPIVRDRYSLAYTSFLDGWDHAMALRHDELAEENHALHGMLMDLCTRMHVRRCGQCKGEGVVSGTLDTCPHCENGWVDQTPSSLPKETTDG